MMDFPIVPILIMGFVVGLDTTAAFQIMVGQPLVACALLGWMMGDPMMGAMVGVMTQLLWMGRLPVGAATFPNGNIGSLVAAALLVQFRDTMIPHGIGVLLAMAVLWGASAAGIGGWVKVWKRKIHTRWVSWFETQAQNGELTRYSWGFMLVVFWNGLVGAVETAILFGIGYGLLLLIIPVLPEQIHRIGFLVPYVLLGIGITQVVILFRLQRWVLMIAGLIVGLLFWGIA
jgi:PTS system mannose-specific IIC component